MARTLSMILAGGEGSRLFPLTQTRTKPAVPVAGGMRLIDFVLNNFVNSELLRIYVLTQFKSQSLNVHLRQAWQLSNLMGNFIDPIPAQMRMGKRWYEGTADAIYQNVQLIKQNEPENVCVFGSDHIYKMDIRAKLSYHVKKKAALTVSGIRLPIKQASRFGVIQVDENYRMIGFEEKPKQPKPLPNDPDMALVSMGNYIFDPEVLIDVLARDSQDPLSSHDFGKDIIPKMFGKYKVMVYDFNLNQIPGESKSYYWRDVGTLYSFWQAHMDLLQLSPELELYNMKWPLRSYHPPVPPAKILGDRQGQDCTIHNSIISPGNILKCCHVERSVLGYKVVVAAGAKLIDSVMLGSCTIGANCHLYRTITDKGVEIAANTQIGVDLEQDRARGLTVTEEGIVVVPKGMKVGN